MSHRATLLHHPAPGNPTHLSRRRVGWVALNIEQSPHFDIRRRPQACQPPHPSPGPSSPRLCFGDLHTNKKCSEPFGSFCSLSFHQIVQKARYLGWRKWVGTKKKKRQRQREGAADERRRKERIGDNGSHA